MLKKKKVLATAETTNWKAVVVANGVTVQTEYYCHKQATERNLIQKSCTSPYRAVVPKLVFSGPHFYNENLLMPLAKESPNEKTQAAL